MRSPEQNLSTSPGPAETREDASVKRKKGMLSRISGMPGEPRSAEASIEPKEDPGKPKKNMLSRISAKIAEPKPGPAGSAADIREDGPVKKGRSMLSRISARPADSKAAVNGPDATEDVSVRKGRGMLSRISARPGESKGNGPDALEDVSARGRRSVLSRISGKPEEPKTGLDTRQSKDCHCEHGHDLPESPEGVTEWQQGSWSQSTARFPSR